MFEFLKTIDHMLFTFFNQAISNPFFDVVMPIITNERFLVVAMLILILSIGFKYKRKGWIILGFTILALGVTDFLSAQIFKPLFGRIRPSHIENFGVLLVGKGGKFSFPSNHAANAFAVSVVLQYIFNMRGKITLFSIGFLIAFTRIYTGVHYPADVFAGAILGTLVGFSALFLLKKLSKHWFVKIN